MRSDELGELKSSVIVALEKTRSSTSRITWTNVFVNESITPEVTAIGGRDALALEETDADCHAGDARRQREVHVARRELHDVDRPVGESDGNRTERRDGLGETRKLCDDRPRDDPSPGRSLEVLA